MFLFWRGRSHNKFNMKALEDRCQVPHGVRTTAVVHSKDERLHAKKIGVEGNRTPGLPHAKRPLYH